MKLNDNLYFYREGGMLDCNTYVIKGKKTMIVDVGLDKKVSSLISDLQKDGIDPQTVDIITNTHLHIDHTCGNEDFKEKAEARIEIAPIQKKFYAVSVRQTSQFFGLNPVEFKADGLLDSSIDLGDIEVDVIPTPGHSPESVCFYCKPIKALICGDLVFDQSTGRSDLPGGDGEQLKKSIEEIAKLKIDFLLPGHMGIITDKEMINHNFEYVRANVFPWL